MPWELRVVTTGQSGKSQEGTVFYWAMYIRVLDELLQDWLLQLIPLSLGLDLKIYSGEVDLLCLQDLVVVMHNITLCP